MNAIAIAGKHPGFQAGDRIVLLHQGRYNGLPGCFVRLREDPNWADIEEPDGSIRAHPVLWLRPGPARRPTLKQTST